MKNWVSTHEDTKNAPVFPYIWRQIEPLIEGLPLVAHNSPFDEGCLKAVMRCYQMDYPDYQFYYACRTSRKHFGKLLPNNPLHTVAATYATTSSTIITPWPMPRLALGLRRRYNYFLSLSPKSSDKSNRK